MFKWNFILFSFFDWQISMKNSILTFQIFPRKENENIDSIENNFLLFLIEFNLFDKNFFWTLIKHYLTRISEQKINEINRFMIIENIDLVLFSENKKTVSVFYFILNEMSNRKFIVMLLIVVQFNSIQWVIKFKWNKKKIVVFFILQVNETCSIDEILFEFER